MQACLAVKWFVRDTRNSRRFRASLALSTKATPLIFNSRAGGEMLAGVKRCVEVADVVDAWFTLRDWKLLAQSSRPAVDRSA